MSAGRNGTGRPPLNSNGSGISIARRFDRQGRRNSFLFAALSIFVDA
jgi:hypothetical protein